MKTEHQPWSFIKEASVIYKSATGKEVYLSYNLADTGTHSALGDLSNQIAVV